MLMTIRDTGMLPAVCMTAKKVIVVSYNDTLIGKGVRYMFGSSEESVGKNDCRVTTGPPLRLDRRGPPFAPLPSHQTSIDGAKG